MDSNTHSGGSRTRPASGRPDGRPDQPDGLAALAALVDQLAAQDLDRLTDATRAGRVLAMRGLVDRLEGQWLKELAGVDARRAAGAEVDQAAASTASWLRARLRLGAGAAARAVRTARAVFSGPLTATAKALTGGVVSPAHAQVLAVGIKDLSDHVTAEAEPVLLEAAARLDPPRLRRAIEHLLQVADPDGTQAQTERRHQRRGLWLSPTWEGMVALDGLLEPEAGHTLLAALEPLARPADADDPRSGSQRTADALTELARRALEAGRLPQTGGVRPQLTVTVDLDSLLGDPAGLGGEAGWAGPLDPEACRRLACDGAITRVLVTRQPSTRGSSAHGSGGEPAWPRHQPNGHLDHRPSSDPHPPDPGPDAAAPPAAYHHRSAGEPLGADDPTRAAGLAGWLRIALTRLPLTLGGTPSQPLDVGRTTRVVQPAQRTALAVRDGGCVFPGCDRPLSWCEAHHLRHWLHGGPTDLANLALLCRAHHRAVHEGGWRLGRGPDGRLTATPPHRKHHTAA